MIACSAPAHDLLHQPRSRASRLTADAERSVRTGSGALLCHPPWLTSVRSCRLGAQSLHLRKRRAAGCRPRRRRPRRLRASAPPRRCGATRRTAGERRGPRPACAKLSRAPTPCAVKRVKLVLEGCIASETRPRNESMGGPRYESMGASKVSGPVRSRARLRVRANCIGCQATNRRVPACSAGCRPTSKQSPVIICHDLSSNG